MKQDKFKNCIKFGCPYSGNCASEGMQCTSCAENPLNKKEDHYKPVIPYNPFMPYAPFTPNDWPPKTIWYCKI